MRCALAGLLLLLLGAVAGAQTPPPGEHPAAAAGNLERTLALLDQVDPQTLPAEQRRALYFALTDALLAAGQPERALDFLVMAAQSPSPESSSTTDEQLLTRLQKIAGPVLVTALQAGTPLAPLLRAELARRGEPIPAAPPERVIGVLLPLSGRYASFGQEVRQGLELALAGQTAAAVRFVYHDTAAEGTAVARLVAALAAQPELLAVIGPLTSSEAAPAAAQAERERLPLLLLAPREGDTGSYVFRNALTMTAQARAVADYAKSEGLQRFVILHPATRHGEQCAGLFQAAVEHNGGRIVVRQSYPAGTIDLRELLQTLAAAIRRGGGSVEALFLPDDARQVAQIIPQLAFARLDQVQLLGINAWNDPALGRMAGPLSEGAVFVDGFFADSPRPEVRDFVAQFQTTYGAPPNILAAQGYDAGRIMLALLARPAVHDRETLRQALSTLRDFSGVTGVTRFDLRGEAEKILFLLQVQDGAVVQIN
ncbi:MAG: hypothetical protein FIB02_04910 [Desulfuromonas sp.]|nr:hypothetical protein [Desulfuromonas sp.]